jgi:hypothetical protein
MEIVHVREIPYDYAKLEIIKYIQNAGDRNVYASELAEKLMLDYDLNNRLKLELAKRLKNLDKKCCFSITYDYAKVL